jgi:extracellular factor (EF) 3-hydroxypalmitic acid methyl ester biosynthesis protein
VYSQAQIDPVVSFLNTQGEAVRGTIVTLQRKSLVMEVYNPYSIVQVSEVLSELTVRMGTASAYIGKAVVISMVNTGLTAVVSVTLIDEWRELSEVVLLPGAVGREASKFVLDWDERFRIRRDYQIAVNEMRAYLAEVARWVEQVDLSDSLPKEGGRLRADVFTELAQPLIVRVRRYFDDLNREAAMVEQEAAAAHRAFAQAALHPLILRAPFVFRTFSKPLGYAGDYQMVNQILGDARQGPSTYFQIVNAAFLQTAVAVAHRNRIDILVDFLKRHADAARRTGRPFRVLNVGCGPAQEIQRFLREYDEPHWLSFELVDFSEETLAWTRGELAAISAGGGGGGPPPPGAGAAPPRTSTAVGGGRVRGRPPRAPAPEQRHPGQHARLAGPGCGAAGRVPAHGGVPEVGQDVHAARPQFRRLRVLILVDHVLGQALGHQHLCLRFHPGGDERGQVQPRVPVEQQLVPYHLSRRAGQHRFQGEGVPGHRPVRDPDVQGVDVELGGLTGLPGIGVQRHGALPSSVRT